MKLLSVFWRLLVVNCLRLALIELLLLGRLLTIGEIWMYCAIFTRKVFGHGLAIWAIWAILTIWTIWVAIPTRVLLVGIASTLNIPHGWRLLLITCIPYAIAW